ncbi:hypothetical protein HIM_01798 [Hirsutella minnesotensis 3608]|nr:hypothetical protein HIM_01798 [Hirsutella minnesotensis 3608]
MVHLTPTIIEAWCYFAINAVVVSARVILRWRTQTFRGLAVDDYLMVFALPLYAAGTAVAYLVEVYTHGLANNDIPPQQRASLDLNSLEGRLRVHGSQLHLCGWILYTALLWTLKICWLFFYKRLGDRVDNMAMKVKLGFVLVISTYLAVFFTILFGCFPVSKHWQINPDPGTVSQLQAWLVVWTNVLTDLYIISIPLPMIWRARISIGRKAGLCVMFCCGLIAAGFGVARCVFILRNDSGDTQFAARWSFRESFLAVLLSNLPILFSLARQDRRITKEASSRSRSGTHGGSSSQSRSAINAFKLSPLSNARAKSRIRLDEQDETPHWGNESQTAFGGTNLSRKHATGYAEP